MPAPVDSDPKPMISVLVSNYNHASYLDQSLSGILRQTFQDFEVIITDDGSKDDSRQIIAGYATRDPRIKPDYFAQNRGAMAATQSNMARARGTLIYGGAADDFIADECFFERAVRALEAHPTAAGYYGIAGLFSAERNQLTGSMGSAPWQGYIAPADFYREFLRANIFVPGNSSIWRRAAMDTVGGFDYALGPQVDFLLNHLLPCRSGIVFESAQVTCQRYYEKNTNYGASGTLWEFAARFAEMEKQLRAVAPPYPDMEVDWCRWRVRWLRESLDRASASLPPPPPPPAPPATVQPSGNAQILTQRVAKLFKVPHLERPGFARRQLTQTHPHIVRAFDAIPRERFSKTVLFVALDADTREVRLAAAARLAGWNPLLLHLEPNPHPAHTDFSFAARLDNVVQLVLACWLFPGALVHSFVLTADHAYLLALTKHQPLILDFQHPAGGVVGVAPQRQQDEKATVPLVNGITHRDLSLKSLQRRQGYSLPRHNLYLPDPLPAPGAPSSANRAAGEIHVIAAGPGALDDRLLRMARAFCTGGVHFHLHLDPAHHGRREIEAYQQMSTESEYFHLGRTASDNSYRAQLAQYDFGLSLAPALPGEAACGCSSDHLRGCASSRLSDYLSVNLGMIVSPDLRFESFLARRFAACTIPATPEFLNQPRPFLEAALQRKTLRNVASISTPAIARRLGAFYTRIANSASARGRVPPSGRQ